ncbi:MAG: sulfatase-like hydrolase/transferase [Lentisphaeria bacterium]|nr:sulfatase-like hydrolase/transferase [Lentisphaeria bacterium]
MAACPHTIPGAPAPGLPPDADRRRFLQLGAGAAAGLCLRPLYGQARKPAPARPNILFIVCDQLGMDALSGHGCPDVKTPNIDRLMARGLSFQLAHSPSPVCSPARSSMFTGRMPTETGVVVNDLAIHPSLAMMGPWFRQAGYETVYCGKWHLPHGYPVAIDGFRILPVGGGQGDLSDALVSRSCEAFLNQRSRTAPFLLTASFMQPHDICYWAIHGRHLVPSELPFPEVRGRLPALPPNYNVRPKAPERLDRCAYTGFNDEQWQFYIYTYYRQVEMLDADVGRLLDALEDTGYADSSLVVFTADHGEGRGRHNHVQKWYPYQEAVSVPLIAAWPGAIPEGAKDTAHLVSHVDILATLCSAADIEAPPSSVGRSLLPAAQGSATEWREFLVCDTHRVGRTVRTERFKYVVYDRDPVQQLFDMIEDPWETRNLADEARYADTIREHRGMLAAWNRQLTPVKDGELTFGL